MRRKQRLLSLALAVMMTAACLAPGMTAYAEGQEDGNSQTETVNGGDPTPTPTPTAEATPAPEAEPTAAPEAPQIRAVTNTHIATYVNTVPTVEGVTWAADVDASDFATAYETVSIQDTNGTTYKVEVVPENTVYFIDSMAASGENGAMADYTTTVPYAAVAALVGDGLLNKTSDQFKTDSNTWGLVETAARTKGMGSLDVTDKTATGVYGETDKADVTISYALTLPGGQYTLTTGHKEWWSGQNRAMALSLTTADGEVAYATIPKMSQNATRTESCSFTLSSEQTVTWTAKSTGSNAPAVSWLAVQKTGEYVAPTATPAPSVPTQPTQPTLPAGLSAPLEDNNGLTYADGTVVSQVNGLANVVDDTIQWNNGGKYHATVADPSVFKSTAFTVLFDVRQDAPDGDTNRVDQRVAMTIGNSTNKLHLLTWSGKFGYGGDSSGVSKNLVTLSGVESGGWNAVAMTYQEKDGGNGSVVVYVNGQKAAEVADIGFKLSTMTDLSSTIIRTFNTNYLQPGRYDNIVVGNVVLDEATAIAETAWRKYQKDNLDLTNAIRDLQDAAAKAETLIGQGFTSDALTAALSAARTLLDKTLTGDDLADVQSALQTLNSAIAAVEPTTITISGTDVAAAAQNQNGLTWKGFGMLNGNSTSNLLLDYKAENPDAYWAMMNYLFGGEHPLFTHIKMEMGNDGNNSTGAEACTMRYENEEADVSRSPGFVMAADAKKINPDVKISFLRWGMPSWVSSYWSSDRTGKGYEAMYKWYRETVFDAYEKYGYVVDFINPDTNETGDPDEAFIKWFENKIVAETDFPSYFTQEAIDAYHNVKIIASDENKGLQIVPSMRSDAELYDAVDVIGFHYRTDATDDYIRMADVDDKEVWYSEGCATFGYTELQENKNSEYGYESIGGYQSPLALMDSFPNAFVGSRRTHYVFQPAIGSFYEGIQYGHKELLSARDPWSGYIHYDPALYMLQHFTSFAVTGWEDSDPTQNEIWRVIANATHGSFGSSSNEHQTAGIDGDASYMTFASPDKKNFSTVFVNNTRNQKTFALEAKDLELTADKLNLWVTETDSYLQNKGQVELKNGKWYITVPAYSVVTATTLDATPLRAPEDDIHNEDRTVLDTDADGRGQDATDTILYADDFEYDEEPAMKQYSAVTKTETSVDYLTARGNEPRYMLDTHGAFVVENGKLKQELDNSVSQWNGGEPTTVVGDFRWMDYTVSVNVEVPDAAAGTYVRLTTRAQTGMNWNNSGYSLELNAASGTWKLWRIGTTVLTGSVDAAADGKYSLKLTALGDTIYLFINNELVGQYTDAAPMLSGRVKLSSTWDQVYFDDLKVQTVEGGIPYATAMIDGQDDAVTYEGTWTISNPGGGSADNWYRTISSTSTAGAAFSFPIDGTGFSLNGGNDGSAVLDVYVDSALVDESAATVASATRGEAYLLDGLTAGQHTVKVVVKSGTLKLDAIHTLGQRLAADDDAVAAVLTEIADIPALLSGTELTGLPAQVQVRTMSGATRTVDVVWDVEGADLDAKAFTGATITGTLKDCVNALDLPVTVSVSIGEVIPAGTVYYIDSVDGTPAANASTEPYAAARALLGDGLLNRVSDQLKTDSNTWGLVDTDAGTKAYTSTADKTATGLYGAVNKADETLSYALTLPAGSYMLVSGHREWWGMTRPMTAELSVNGQTISAGTLALSGSSGDLVNTVSFTLDSDQTITYTVTSTGDQAPVISWLAVTKQDSAEARAQARAELEALIETIETAVAENQANGVVYATEPLQPGEYTNTDEVVPDTIGDLENALKAAKDLLDNADATVSQLISAANTLNTVYEDLRVLPTYDSIPGTDGDVIYADNGVAMQVHGGSAMAMKEGAGEGCVNFDLDGDGQITEGKTVYLWYGENKTNDTHPVDGVRCYVSTDLYNWTDRGNVLYLQNSILPIEGSDEAAITSEKGASGVGTTQDYNAMQLSAANFETLKAWGKLETAPAGVSQEDFDKVKLFLRAYVTEFDKAPTGQFDTAWTAKSYDESSITAASFLYPDSTEESVRTQTTSPLQLAFEGLYGDYCITERPKVVYNESTEQFVLVFHADGPLYNNEALNEWMADGCEGNCAASRYGRALVGFATSDTPFGPFKLVNMTRMNYDTELNAQRLGESRDMTVFVDEGVDKNQDGVDDAYVIYSSEMNAKLYISLLNSSYTAPIAEGDDAEVGVEYAARILSDNSREAPAVFKYDGWYYLITSGTDGWNSTEHIYYRSQDLLSGWEKVGSPAVNDTGKCFNTQVTYVLPVDAEAGKFIYMGDRWNGSDLSDSRTVWLPIQMKTDNTLAVLGRNDWTLDLLDSLTPATLNTTLPGTIWADGSNLPGTINVTWQGRTLDTPVTWTITNMGQTTVTGTLPDCGNAQVTVNALVLPRNLIYFADPSSDPVSGDFTAIVQAAAGTLLQDPAVNDGAYSADAGFGYTGAAGSVRGNNADIYQSLRYASGSDSITYRFDVTEGEYEVYVGMFDPASWANWNPGRTADIKINGETRTTGYDYLNNESDTLHYTGITMSADGALTVEVARNSASDSAVQVSFIMVARKPAAAPAPGGSSASGSTGSTAAGTTAASAIRTNPQTSDAAGNTLEIAAVLALVSLAGLCVLTVLRRKNNR